MSKQNVKKAVKKKNGYQMPDPIPNGEILQDIAKKKWIIGPSIGVGGFGEIYSAAEYKDDKPKDYPYVIKIEPHGNGPLFVEMHFYMRNAKRDDIENWRSSKNLKSLGMPAYIASGSHECNGTKYRFVVMEKFGKDLWKLYLENNRCFPTHTAFKIGVQLLDILEYIHSKGYVHADIKGQNALLGLSKSTQNQVYLVDFGLAAHYSTKDFKPDPKKAHNGTIEYTSRDAHHGVPTRRGDLEILGYNLIHWLGGTLPWDSSLTNPVTVQAAKENFFHKLDESLKACFKSTELPDALKKYFTYVKKMDHDSDPDYKKLHSFLMSGIEDTGHKLSDPLTFSVKLKSPKRKKDEKHVDTPDKKRKITKKVTKKIELISDAEEDTTKGKEKEAINQKKKVGRKKKVEEVKVVESEKMETEDIIPNGYTAEMVRMMKKIEEKKSKPKGKRGALKSDSSAGSSKGKKSSMDISDEDIIEGTPSPPRNSRKKVIQITNSSASTTPTRASARSKKAVYYGSDSD